MKRAIQVKVNNLIALSKKSGTTVKIAHRATSDSLSTSIRTKKDAEIFRRELNSAFKSAKNKH